MRPDEVERKLKMGYVYDGRDRTRKLLDDVHSLISHLDDKGLELKDILQEAADIICESLWVRDVTIGLRSASDGMYRYEVMAGLRDGTWKAHAGIEYTDEQLNDPEIFKGRRISEHTKVFLGEDEPYLGEEDMFDRPILLKTHRRSMDECMEGDSLETDIIDQKGNLIGWIEVSATKDGKFPDAKAIRWIELIASLLSICIERRSESAERDNSRRSLGTHRVR